MAKAQSEADQSAGATTPFSPGWRDLGWLSVYCMRGIAELAWARVIFARMPASDIRVRNAKHASAGHAKDPQQLDISEQRRVDRIAYVIPRLGEYMPWRSDCVPQALAAQRWLGGKGIPSAIRVGVERPEDGDFGAHAWLVVGERIVTGGRVEQYQLLLGESEK